MTARTAGPTLSLTRPSVCAAGTGDQDGQSLSRKEQATLGPLRLGRGQRLREQQVRLPTQGAAPPGAKGPPEPAGLRASGPVRARLRFELSLSSLQSFLWSALLLSQIPPYKPHADATSPCS